MALSDNIDPGKPPVRASALSLVGAWHREGEHPRLAVDVGGTRVKVGLISDGRLHVAAVQPTAHTPAGLVAQLAVIHRAYGSPEHWALCLPGPVSDGIWWAHLPFPVGAVPIRRMLSDWWLPVPFMCRDAEAALVGEAGERSIALIQLGTGIGCGVTVEGKVLRDALGELLGVWMAHVPLFEDGAPCARCGGRGCASSHASMRGIADQLAEELSPSELRERALRDEHPYADVYRRAVDAVARLAQIAVMSFRPDEVRLAGGCTREWAPELIPHVRAAVSRLPYGARESTSVTMSEAGELAALHGLMRTAVQASPGIASSRQALGAHWAPV